MNKNNHPGIYLPPPLIYVAIFLASLSLQNFQPIPRNWFHTSYAHLIGGVFILLYVILAIMAIGQFVRTKNTIVTVKPATSLQTTGIYSFSRNPMYLALVLLYSGLAIFLGNWWTFILLPFLILVIQYYVIRKEEQYLNFAFGDQYEAYKRKVRRWV